MNDREWAEHLFMSDMEDWIIADRDQVLDPDGPVQWDVEDYDIVNSDDGSGEEISEPEDMDEDLNLSDDSSSNLEASSSTAKSKSERDPNDPWKAHRLKCLGKRLAYLLRYGANKEGLKLHFGDFVRLDDLLSHRMMRWHPRDEVLAEVNKSYSHRGYKRFEVKEQAGETFIRACYGRKMDRNPCHGDSGVTRLLDQCLGVITANLDMYDLNDFPDEYIITLLLHKLKRQKRLNNSILKAVLCPVVEKLDLEGVYLTESTLKTVTRQCPNLTFLSLRNCGYIITDHTFSMVIKKLQKLEVLNLSGCSLLTDQCLKSILKLPKLRKLNICDLHLLTEAAILDFLNRAPSLKLVDIFSLRIEDKKKLVGIVRGKGIKVVLKGLKAKDIVPDNAEALPLQFRLTDG